MEVEEGEYDGEEDDGLEAEEEEEEEEEEVSYYIHLPYQCVCIYILMSSCVGGSKAPHALYQGEIRAARAISTSNECYINFRKNRLENWFRSNFCASIRSNAVMTT